MTTNLPDLPPSSPPSAEEQALWRARFARFAIFRLAGLILIVVGVAIAVSGLIRPGGIPLVGGPLAVVGVVIGMVVPHRMRRDWERG